MNIRGSTHNSRLYKCYNVSEGTMIYILFKDMTVGQVNDYVIEHDLRVYDVLGNAKFIII